MMLLIFALAFSFSFSVIYRRHSCFRLIWSRYSHMWYGTSFGGMGFGFTFFVRWQAAGSLRAFVSVFFKFFTVSFVSNIIPSNSSSSFVPCEFILETSDSVNVFVGFASPLWMRSIKSSITSLFLWSQYSSNGWETAMPHPLLWEYFHCCC